MINDYVIMKINDMQQ